MQKARTIKTDLQFLSLDTRRKTDMIVIHHTGNPTDDDLSAAEIHASHQAQGWAGIGYHYVVLDILPPALAVGSMSRCRWVRMGR